MDVKGCRRKNISASTENEKGIEKKNYLLKLIKKEQVMLNHSFNIKILSLCALYTLYSMSHKTIK